MNPTDKKKFEKAIAKWLAGLREEKEISQDFLAIQLGKGQSDIAKIENASRKVTPLEILSWMVALGIPYDQLDTVLKPIYSELVNKNNPWENEN